MNECFGLVEKGPFLYRCCLLNKQHASFSHTIAPEGKINPPNLPGTENEALVHLASETKDWHVEDATHIDY